MTLDALVAFLQAHRLGVVATRGADGAPQAAVVGLAVSDAGELVFDTLESSRKARNLRGDARIAVVVHDDATTAQLEGVADFPTGDERDRLLAVYLAVYPDGRDRLAWEGITHVRVRPTWVRVSDYRVDPPRIEEWTP